MGDKGKKDKGKREEQKKSYEYSKGKAEEKERKSTIDLAKRKIETKIKRQFMMSRGCFSFLCGKGKLNLKSTRILFVRRGAMNKRKNEA